MHVSSALTNDFGKKKTRVNLSPRYIYDLLYSINFNMQQITHYLSYKFVGWEESCSAYFIPIWMVGTQQIN